MIRDPDPDVAERLREADSFGGTSQAKPAATRALAAAVVELTAEVVKLREAVEAGPGV